MTPEQILVAMAAIRFEIEHPGEQWPPENTQVIQAYIDDEIEAIKRLKERGIVLIGADELENLTTAAHDNYR